MIVANHVEGECRVDIDTAIPGPKVVMRWIIGWFRVDGSRLVGGKTVDNEGCNLWLTAVTNL